MTEPIKISNYTIYDPGGKITTSAYGVHRNGTALTSDTGRVYKDYGIGYFDSGFEITFDATAYDTAPNGGSWTCLNLFGQVEGDENYQSANHPDGYMTLEINDNAGSGVTIIGISVTSISYPQRWQFISSLNTDTKYYYRFLRDETIAPFGYAYLFAYSDEAMTNLVGSCSVDLPAKFDWRYHYILDTFDGYDRGDYFQNVEINNVKLTKFENFLTDYNITDPLNKLTITENSIQSNQQLRSESAYTYKDFGIDYFSGDIEFNFEYSINYTGLGGQWINIGFSNLIGNFAENQSSGLWKFIGIYAVAQATGDYRNLYLQEFNLTNAWYSDRATELILGQTYYCKYIRNDADSQFGTQYLYVYTDRQHLTLHFLASLPLHSKEDFRYFFPYMGVNDGVYPFWVDHYIANLSINKVDNFINLQAYQITDNNNRFTFPVDGTVVTLTDITRNEVATIARYISTNWFLNNNIIIDCAFTITADTGSIIDILNFGRENSSIKYGTDIHQVTVSIQMGGLFYLAEQYGPTSFQNAPGIGWSLNVPYYLRFIYDKTNNLIILNVYSDYGRYNLLTTVSMSPVNPSEFKWFMPVTSYWDGGASTMSGVFGPFNWLYGEPPSFITHHPFPSFRSY